MKKTVVLSRNSNHGWTTHSANADPTTYRNKTEALQAARKIAGQGTPVIVQGANGQIQQVLGVGERDKTSIKPAPVKHKRSNRDVNIAIAKVLGNP